MAESRYHDIAPANRLGIKCVWVNRANRGGGTRGADAVPDLVVPDLATLARMTCPAVISPPASSGGTLVEPGRTDLNDSEQKHIREPACKGPRPVGRVLHRR